LYCYNYVNARGCWNALVRSNANVLYIKEQNINDNSLQETQETDIMGTAKIMVCIPAFNAAKNIGQVIDKAKRYAHEVVVYDDGSVDRTNEIVKDAGATLIRHPINKGYGAAIKKLFRLAREKNADIMVTLDSDGQHDPDYIPSLIKPISNDGFDMVIGSRFLSEEGEKKVPRYRSLGIRTITKFAKAISFSNLTDAQSGFRAYSKDAIAKINLFEEGMSVSAEILLRAKENGLSVKEVPVTIDYDVVRRSTHNAVSHGIGVLYSIIHFISLRHPLLCYGIAGIALLVVAASYTTNAVELFSKTRFVSTNLILLSVGTALVGIVLLATGTIIYSIKALLKGRLGDI
jgi:glycosyltransferase involved in cell wall biosynthesis